MVDAARQVRPDLKVLFITGYAENAAVSNGHLEPGMHVLTKPLAIEVIAARIRAIIEVPCNVLVAPAALPSSTASAAPVTNKLEGWG